MLDFRYELAFSLMIVTQFNRFFCVILKGYNSYNIDFLCQSCNLCLSASCLNSVLIDEKMFKITMLETMY